MGGTGVAVVCKVSDHGDGRAGCPWHIQRTGSPEVVLHYRNRKGLPSTTEPIGKAQSTKTLNNARKELRAKPWKTEFSGLGLFPD